MSDELHVIFGTGAVGLAVLDELKAKDHRVRMVNRSGTTSEPLPVGVELVVGDASDPGFALQATEGASVVYQALNPPYSKWAEMFPPLQDSVTAAAQAHNAKLVVMDNLYMYGDPNGQVIREDMPHAAHTKKGKVRAQMAETVMQAHHAGKVQVAVGRASDFFGERVRQAALGGNFVVEKALQGKPAQVLGNIDVPHSHTYIRDVGKALVTLAEHDDAFGQVWHIPSLPAITTREALQMIYAAAEHPVKVQPTPKWLLRLFGLMNPDAGEMVEMLYAFEKPFVLDDMKFVERFGWQATDWETAVMNTVTWFKHRAIT